MTRHHKPKAFWRLARIWFRHVRITVWLVILLVLVSLLYLHNIGFPGFARRAVIGAFEARGLQLDFSKLYLSWFRGIEAQNVSLQASGSGPRPRIECRRVDLNFDPLAVLILKIVPQSLGIVDGQLILPYQQENGLPGRLTATDIQVLIQFQSDGGITLNSLTGEMAGCRLSASGTVRNPQRIQDWSLLQRWASRPDPDSGQVDTLWRTISSITRQVEFLTTPELRLAFDIDGAAPEEMDFYFSAMADAAVAPLGLLDHPEVTLQMRPLQSNACSEVELLVQAARIESDAGAGNSLTLHSTFSCLAENGCIQAGRTTFSAEQLDTSWVGASHLEGSLGWTCDGTNLFPQMANLEINAGELSTGFGWAHNVQAKFSLEPFTGDHRQILDLPGFIFSRLEPFALGASFKAGTVRTAWLSATNLNLAAGWASPRLSITNLSVDWGGGHLDAGAAFNAISGRLNFKASSDFDPKRFYSILPQEAVDWLDFFTWKNPPGVNGVGGVTLPEWKPYQLLWPGDLRPSLYLNGRFDVGQGTYQRIPLSGAASHFIYSNMCWNLPDLTVRRPEGFLLLKHHNNDRTREFVWKVDGALDPTPALILLPEHATNALEVLETLKFGGPPEVHLTFTGQWSDIEAARGWGSIIATNLSFRGKSFDRIEARLGLTNLTLTVSDPVAKAGKEEASADSITFNFPQNLAFLTNGISTMDPMRVATVIGPDVVKAIRPYHFLNPPTGRVEGTIPLKGVQGADLRFNLEGGPFEWWNFHLSEIQGQVHWREETVDLKIPRAGFYGGTASGDGFFDFTGKTDAGFHFNLLVDDADMQSLVTGVFQSTNRMEGVLSGSLSITNANTGDFDSWFGYGYVILKDGFIWNVPVFGIVSPVLDMFVPGLGSSLAKEAEGRYTITNSVIRTDDLLIHTSNMRLLYTGTLDFEGNVNAVAEAEILRDTFIVGEFVSTALTPLSKALVVDITGTLKEPEARPLYFLPRLLLAPLNPVKLFKDIFAPPAPKFEKQSPDASGEPQPEPPPSSDPAQ